MFLSRYALVYPWPDDSELRLVYSTLNAAKALIPAAILEDLQKGCLDEDEESMLREQGLVVDDLKKEKEEAFQLVERINSRRTAMNVSVIVNLQCNFRCRYCYEGSQKGKSVMSKQTADQLAGFIKERFQPGMTRLTLDFYGGEPLLATALIKHLAASLQPFVEELGALFETTLVTNGSLLTRKTVQKLLPFGLKRAKITIDGPPENHNFFRPYQSGKPSFDVIVGNIRECADLLKIAINGNFTEENYREFPQLFDHLEQQGLTPENIHQLSFSPVMQVRDDFSSGFCGGCASSNEKWLAQAAPFLREEILKHGYPANEITPSLCMVDVENSFVVHYDGRLYQCVAMIGHKEYSCGDVWQGMRDYRQQYHLDHWKNEEKCLDCTYLPLCFGGCRYMAYQRDGHMAKVDCQKDFLDATLEASIKQEITYLP
ncbi:MAG: geopeptide radical SAM maturase [Desulfobulbaceae bacterium]|nr:geopeptide radical SAM maturase [Desulfobulbaceae bacterium]